MKSSERSATTALSSLWDFDLLHWPAGLLKRRWLARLAERLIEPLHLNAASALVALAGSYRAKVAFDLIPRRHYAYGVLRSADLAREAGLSAITVLEFGVACGAGLLNLCQIAASVSRVTKVEISVVGLDSGRGLPLPIDYRDHPDIFQAGDYPMHEETLRRQLPSSARLIIGDFRETVPELAKTLDRSAPVGFASLDVDYYSSAAEALRLFADPDPEKFLSNTLLYVDDIIFETANNWCGELLAINEFNVGQPARKIQPDHFLRARRIFGRAAWLDQIYILHVLDHPVMRSGCPRSPRTL